MFNCEYVKEMLERIMSNKRIKGDSFYEKILNAIEKDNIEKIRL